MSAEPKGLSRRERQIMDIVYRREKVSVRDVQDELPEAPSYSTVRALLRILEEKGHLIHREEGERYIYLAKVPRAKARASALRKLVETFFDNSVEQAVLALLELKEGADPKELQRLRSRIEKETTKGEK